MDDFQGWAKVSAHLTTQQRLEIKNQHREQNGDGTALVHQLDDGWSIKKLNGTTDHQLEGQLMDNCVGGYGPERGDHDIYSLRDENDLPYVTFRMRRRTRDDHNDYSTWTRTTDQEEADTGRDVLTTSQVLGRNNEAPKEDYGKHLVKALSEVAKNEGIPHISWDGGPLKTPEDLDNFLARDSEPPPQDMYLKVPVGMKNDDGSINFGNERFGHRLIKVSPEPFEPQYGYHVMKTPYSDKRFERTDDLKTRLNDPEGMTNDWHIKDKPGDQRGLPNVEGLKSTQVQMIHEAQTPRDIYLKMTPRAWDEASTSCAHCAGTGKKDRNSGYYGENCEVCEGEGTGSHFSIPRGYYGSRVQATANLDELVNEDGENADYDNHIVKVPFSEENFNFDPKTGKYTAKGNAEWTPLAQGQAQVYKKAALPSKVYIAVPSSDRGDRNVYSEDGIEPVFLKNSKAVISRNRSHFVGAKGNDIIEVDTSKLPEGALLDHTTERGQGRRNDWNRPATDMWELNPKVAIPYEAVTKPHSHEVADAQIRQHMDIEHGGGRWQEMMNLDNDGLHEEHQQMHINGELGERHTPMEPGREINVVDPSGMNKRKKHVVPLPRDIDGALKVTHEATEAPSTVRFTTSIAGRTIEDIKSLEAGNFPKAEGVGHEGEPGEPFSSSGGIRAHVAYDPDFVEEITPTIAQIRAGGGAVNIGESGLQLRYDHERRPGKQRYFQMKQDIPAGHPSLKGIEYSTQMEAAKGDRASIIPDVGFLHIPRRFRGNEELYSEEGINPHHARDDDRYREGNSTTIYDRPLRGERNELRTDEDPNEFDVWALDMHKIPKARLQNVTNPYQYNSPHREEKITGFDAPTDEQGQIQTIPWEAITRLHRKPVEPTAPAVRKYFNTASVSGWKRMFITR